MNFYALLSKVNYIAFNYIWWVHAFPWNWPHDLGVASTMLCGGVHTCKTHWLNAKVVSIILSPAPYYFPLNSSRKTAELTYLAGLYVELSEISSKHAAVIMARFRTGRKFELKVQSIKVCANNQLRSGPS